MRNDFLIYEKGQHSPFHNAKRQSDNDSLDVGKNQHMIRKVWLRCKYQIIAQGRVYCKYE